MKYVVLTLALVLGGCATTPSTVKIPIAVTCTTAAPIPPAYRYAPPYDSIFEAVRDLLGDRELSTAYEIELTAALKSCK